MATRNVRSSAIDTISRVTAKGGKVDYTIRSVRDVYCESVFTKEVQRQRLPKNMFKALQNSIQNGEELGESVADSVALAMRDWAIEKGATHFCHWFQPMTGKTAEKHDSFITPVGEEDVIAQFSGKDLVRGEPDASSFPSGGLRATFEARGYTAWDPSSPAFILDNPNGATLVIPTMFVSWTGEALDKKTPLLRSMDAVSEQAIRLLRLFGNTTSKRAISSIGVEQEYFLVDKHFYYSRPDLLNTGRTLFGAKPPKGQELDDNYFGAIPERVLSFMAEVEFELLKLGVPIKTRHNEVAPGQYELAPTFETANVAVDHNMITMEVMRKVADNHGFAYLLHEKPFAGVNGSGKHNNWSIGTDDGLKLLDPGDNPHDNAQFLMFCAASCLAIKKHGALLRASVASAGNDHRLGANEAPPAILSVYLGQQLTDVFNQLETGKATGSKKMKPIEVGVSMLPKLPRHAGDRNRTSPFAFTGNKFEFRAVGSNQSPAGSTTVINTIMADALDEICTKLEGMISGKVDINKACQKLLPELIKEFKPILFDGDGYSQGWHEEAEKRGLPNLRTTVDATPALLDKKVVAMFKKYKVLSKRELQSRHEINLENYCGIVGIEADCCSMMANTMILPASLRYQAEMAAAVTNAKAAGIENDAQLEMLEDLVETIGAFKKATDTLDQAIAHDTNGGALKHATHMRDVVLAAMNEVRFLGDKLQTMVADNYWPLPSYNEMLFIR